MKYLTIAADYADSCITDDYKGQLECSELLPGHNLCREFDSWNDDYKSIIPLDMDEREQHRQEIEILDERGIILAKKLLNALNGKAKIKYYSEGKLELLKIINDQ